MVFITNYKGFNTNISIKMEALNITMIPTEKLEKLDLIYQRQEEILKALESKNLIKPSEHLLIEEFLIQTKMSRSKFERLRSNGNLLSKKLGRIIYVPATEVQRYFRGEIK
jgi:hypothetical protein